MHAAIAEADELAEIDQIHSCGSLMKSLHDALPMAKRGEWFENSTELAAHARRALDAGDVAMVKGSLGSRMAVVVEAIRKIGAAERIDVTEGAD